MEKKVDRIAREVEQFLEQNHKSQTSLQIIKMRAKVEDARSMLQSLELDLKVKSSVGKDTISLKKQLTDQN